MPRDIRPLTVDILVVKNNQIVLVKRKFSPFQGLWAIPGGFVEPHETVEQSAVREAKEETGLDVRLTKLLGVYSDPERDPERHTVAVAYIAEVLGGELAESNETEPKWFGLDALPALAFDHTNIITDLKKELQDGV